LERGVLGIKGGTPDGSRKEDFISENVDIPEGSYRRLQTFEGELEKKPCGALLHRGSSKRRYGPAEGRRGACRKRVLQEKKKPEPKTDREGAWRQGGECPSGLKRRNRKEEGGPLELLVLEKKLISHAPSQRRGGAVAPEKNCFSGSQAS